MAVRKERTRAPLEVDRESLLELARGGNLYRERFACIRELVQNAADATLLRVFAESGASAFPTHEGSLADLRKRLAAHPIDVSIERLEDDARGPTTLRRYRVVVEDRGSGIARRDVPHLQRIASSRKNPARARMIAAMPEWMRPSGTFGIGLQSAFLVADELVLDTRTTEGEASTIVLRASGGGTLELREGRRQRIGTRVELIARLALDSEAHPSYRRDEEPQDPLESTLDPFAESALAVGRASGAGSVVPVVLQGARVASSFEAAHAWFDPVQLIEIVLPERDGPGVSDHLRVRDHDGESFFRDLATRAHYRGAALETMTETVIAGLRTTFNLHAATARDVLLVGRDTIAPRAREWVRSRIEAAITRRMPALLDRVGPRSGSVRAWLSAHARTLRCANAGTEWRDIVLARTAAGESLTLGRAVDLGAITTHTPPPRRDDGGARIRWLEQYVSLSDGTTATSMPGFDRLRLLHDFFPGRRLDSAGSYTETVVDESVVTEEYVLVDLATNDHHAVRPILNLPNGLEVLALPTEAPRELGWHSHIRPEEVREYFLSPWTIRNDTVELPHLRRWITWTARPTYGPRRTRAGVAAGLIGLLRRADPILRASPWRKVAYDLDAVIAEIARAYPSVASRPKEKAKPRRSTRAR